MSGPDRAVCVHGHFYQPPRENPWTGEIDPEPSAAPWDNWNERIADECYAANLAAAIQEDAGGVGPGNDGAASRRRNNYASLSFDVGPTLMAWIASARPELHDEIVAADREAVARRGGHGGAIAQAHDHMIMPLASARDRRTQVLWGLADFRHRFGRPAAGMWLPETAVDMPTLEALAGAGVRFTILAPHQARRVRAPGGSWRPTGGSVDTGRGYRHPLPSGREISLVFYDGGIAHEVAFGGLLHDGAAFASRLTAAARSGEPPRLAHVATDGESYGHHHRHGEMALAWALDALERAAGPSIVNYAEWLDAHPPEWEVEVAGPTSWSCAHGVRRWAGGCTCGTGGDGWDYGWRASLREAQDRLAAAMTARYEAAGATVLRDPWAARDEAAVLWLGDAGEAEAFWARHLADAAERDGRRLLEMQRATMRMFTSCGWFFDDPAGLETRQVLRYAARALDLAGAWNADGSTEDPDALVWLAALEEIGSNREEGWTAAGEVRRILREDRPTDVRRGRSVSPRAG